jgi:hypothetical protein
MPKGDPTGPQNKGTGPRIGTVTAVNKLQIARPGQTIELSVKDLAALGEKDLARIHITDATGKELLCQSVDTDLIPVART